MFVPILLFSILCNLKEIYYAFYFFLSFIVLYRFLCNLVKRFSFFLKERQKGQNPSPLQQKTLLLKRLVSSPAFNYLTS